MTGFITKLSIAVEKRQTDLELELAAARRVPLLYMDLTGEPPVPFWDFHHTQEMIAQGYEKARQVLEAHPEFMAEITPKRRWWNLLGG